ncbi:MAG: hypothetical protein GY702_16790, partial [Desulfobulbaceae bacterium]|nr:hypothetical protein [Desulfobulbaceae bacterium]
PFTRLVPYYWQAGIFINLPLCFSLFLLKNDYSQVWVMSILVATFLLTLSADWICANVLFFLGTFLAWIIHLLTTDAPVDLSNYLQVQLVSFFALFMGGAINYRLMQYRRSQREFEKKMMMVSNQNKNMIRQYNQMLSRFLNNIIVKRLVKLQDEFGLEQAIKVITEQKRRFCAIMQADVRNFTKMLTPETEHQVAQLISRCFDEVTKIGQDVAVIKPVGDCIFVYSDDENGKDSAVRSILALALLLVRSVEELNQTRLPEKAPPINFGIALHAGEVTYGNLASETFIDPTIIGLNVNKTARLEELTKSRVKAVSGPNGILLSEEFAELCRDYFDREDLVHINLTAMGITVRDFPLISTVYAITRETAETYYQSVQTYISRDPSQAHMTTDAVDRNTSDGVDYYYDMQGIGADTTWNILINVSRFSKNLVGLYASRNLKDLNYRIRDGVERWIELSTKKSPGEFDEFDIEERIIKIIEGLILLDRP